MQAPVRPALAPLCESIVPASVPLKTTVVPIFESDLHHKLRCHRDVSNPQSPAPDFSKQPFGAGHLHPSA